MTRQFDLREAHALLERTPPTLGAWLSGLEDGWIHANEGADSWSPSEVVRHLIHGEPDWIPRARIILEQGGAGAFGPIDRSAHEAAMQGLVLASRLDLFASLRRANLQALDAWELGPAELLLRGEHPAFGSVTLEQLLATWVAHDLGHIGQIVRVMAKRYAEDVGPWRAHLRVLQS